MIIHKILKFVLPVILAIVQITLMPLLSVWGGYPNILVIGITFAILFDNENEAMLIAIIGGILLDFASVTPMGLNLLMFILFVIALKFVKKYLPELNMFIILMVVFINSLIFSLISSIVLNHFNIYLTIIDSFYALTLSFGVFIFLNSKYKKSQLIKLGNE